jgi:DNA-binding NarL/FixJ family response regulator
MFIMPEMNGLQLAKAIRVGVDKTRRDLPIAMLTGHSDESWSAGSSVGCKCLPVKTGEQSILWQHAGDRFTSRSRRETMVKSSEFMPTSRSTSISTA